MDACIIKKSELKIKTKKGLLCSIIFIMIVNQKQDCKFGVYYKLKLIILRYGNSKS